MPFQSVCVVGLGYIGLPTAATFASRGLAVTGVDINPELLKNLQNGKVLIHEPGLQELFSSTLQSGNLTLSAVPVPADAFIIAVPTPFTAEKKPDLNYVISATQSIVSVLKPGNLVMLESTSPPRTTVDVVAPILEQSGLIAGQDFYLAYTPERGFPGQILRELTQNPRVIGGINPASADKGRELYQLFVEGDIVTSDATTAEMVKLMENTFRDVNIALANEFSRLADRYQVNIWNAIKIANLHPRVKILNPGPGVGGHCISVDPWFLVDAAPDIAQLIRTAREVNDSQPEFVLSWIREKMGGNLTSCKLAVLGLAFKPNVDDLRESPAMEITQMLADEGASITAFEPYLTSSKTLPFPVVHTLEEAARNVDAIIFLVAHRPFQTLDLQQLKGMTDCRLLLDAVNCIDDQEAKKAGFELWHFGGNEPRYD